MTIRLIPLLLELILAGSCSDVVCGCAMPVTARLYGSVRAGATPVPGAAIKVRSAVFGVCPTASVSPNLVPADTLSRADGSFGVTVYGGVAATYCLRVTAVRAALDDSAVVSGIAVAFHTGSGSDSVRVLLMFP